MYANSRRPQSAQDGIHPQLARQLERHRQSVFQKPILDYNQRAFDAALAAHAQHGESSALILDAACGTGVSSIRLAERHPEAFVIGVDQSAKRLQTVKKALPANLVLVRADLVDFWRLLAASGKKLSAHYLFYPNPWPKPEHLGRRWHGHAVFPVLLRLGGSIECRSNWQIYIEEFAFALHQLSGRNPGWEEFTPGEDAASPFERKYRDSGQPLYRSRWVPL